MSKTILVLGARSDIAQATANEFARAGFDVILAARDAGSLDPTRSDLEIRHGVKAYTAEFDAADFASHQSFYADLPVSPDVALYSVGYLGDQKKAETDWPEAETIINANYVGAASILSVIANDLEKRKEGAIIGISSVAGERGRQSNYIYGSAKAGFTAFLAGLRHRLAASNVQVITVKPGFVATRMTAGMELPKRLTATPSDLGAAIFRAYRKRKHTIYFLPSWRLIMLAIRNVPESIFVRSKL
jgi:decaprenylphospho-beta-D-erythro-pentofuranosid-2-ulose 2-reductase